MKKPLTENFWLMTALTIVPVFGSFAGYRYWMRMRAKKALLTLSAEELYELLTGTEAPLDKQFTLEEKDDMASRLAATDAPFWHFNWVPAEPQSDEAEDE